MAGNRGRRRPKETGCFDCFKPRARNEDPPSRPIPLRTLQVRESQRPTESQEPPRPSRRLRDQRGAHRASMVSSVTAASRPLSPISDYSPTALSRGQIPHRHSSRKSRNRAPQSPLESDDSPIGVDLDDLWDFTPERTTSPGSTRRSSHGPAGFSRREAPIQEDSDEDESEEEEERPRQPYFSPVVPSPVHLSPHTAQTRYTGEDGRGSNKSPLQRISEAIAE